jgi:NAD(P)-dependent dehydrogenase (short-subunit alcohol dehydrogenase family)
MSLPNRELTEDGFEKQIGVNHMGHFVLTSGLYELLKKGTNPRVVNVASSAHTLAQFDQNDLMLSKEGTYLR